MNIFPLLITLLVVVVIIWACRTLLAAFDPGPQISAVIYVLVVMLVVFWLLGQFGTLGGHPARFP